VKTILDHIYLQIKHIVLTLGPLIYKTGGTRGCKCARCRIGLVPLLGAREQGRERRSLE